MLLPPVALAEDSAAELAKKLSNPVASLISVPIQYNHDTGLGPNNADRNITNIQPVIPFELNEDANIISRTILPVVNYGSTMAGDRGASGIGDVMQSFFYSPKNPTANGWIWGAGVAIQIPTANKEDLGSGKWSAGPTAVLLRQQNGWTYGGLVSHIDSFAGQSNRQFVDTTFLQPFLSYTTGTYTTFGINSEATYDGQSNEWTTPLNFTVAQLLKIGGQPVQFQIGYRKYVTNPDYTPEEGVRASVTFLFPR
ncbi:MAG: transporter [Pseudomonadales bacterium]|nr:transporter [Pseudomonadales bacterium]